MKKILFSIAMLTGLTVNAQLPDGSSAPDFTLTDINGVSHNLYTYLDQGKTVFIDVSATWCSPCWGFHGTGALDDLWAQHGPTGGTGVLPTTTNDVIVLFIEGDGDTGSAELNGGSGSQGDWVSGVDHPIIDPAAAIINPFNDSYAIGYFPTIYKICPNRVITEVGQASAAALYGGVADCPAPATSVADVKASANKGNTNICGPADYTPKVEIQNYSLTALTSATVSVTFNGTEVATGTYSGTLDSYGVATVTCSVIPNFSGGTLMYTVTTSNDANAGNGTLSASVIGSIETSANLLLDIKTDFWQEEISWKIKNAGGTTVVGTTNPTLADDTQYNLTYTMPENGCYTFSIQDDFGDGILNGQVLDGGVTKTATGMLNLRDDQGTVLSTNIEYGFGMDITFKVVAQAATAPTVSSSVAAVNGTITICQGATVTLSSSTAPSYLWSNGATTQTITVNVAGNYSVTANNLTSTVSAVNFVNCAGIDENELNNITVFPNPSNGNVSIKSELLTQYNTVELVDLSGRTLATWEINATAMNIEMKEIANGNYSLVFKGENTISTQKIQINK